jgi:hypothetical protein
MTSHAANRKEGVSTSCLSRSRRLRAFTQKEPETVKVAQELLGAPTIGGASAWSGGGGGGSQISKISLPSHPECMKRCQDDRFPALI